MEVCKFKRRLKRREDGFWQFEPTASELDYMRCVLTADFWLNATRKAVELKDPHALAVFGDIVVMNGPLSEASSGAAYFVASLLPDT